MAIRLTVTSAPEAGKSRTFHAPVISVGRGPRNDLVLQDGLVSQYHGEVLLRDRSYVYRDLRSRHGTRVRVNHVTVNLQDRHNAQEVRLVDGAELLLGESSLGVQIDPHDWRARAGESTDALSSLGFRTESGPPTNIDEQIVTRTQNSLDAVAKRLSRQDPRLVSIFKLSRNLNAASDLQEILDLIVNATFEAFPAANFFAISIPPASGRGDMSPLISRERNPDREPSANALLSQSLLEKVAQTRESVLFVRDDAGRELTESIINARIMACLAAPLVGQSSLIGVMQTDTRGLGGLFGPDDLDLFTVMASYAAFAIERVRMTDQIYEMFEGIVRASVTAIDARDPSTAGHSDRVAKLTIDLAQAVDTTENGPLAAVRFSESELTELRYAALLHDFGKIGVREQVLTKAERLYPERKRELVARFDQIKTLRSLQLHRDVQQALLVSGDPLDPETHHRLDRAVQAVCADLDDTLAFLLESVRAPELSTDAIRRIERLGELRYTDIGGNRHPYLLEDEIAALCVRLGTLTPQEWEDMKGHAAKSREYLEKIPWSADLANIPCIAGWHHEKLDGSGYPDGIGGAQIPHQVRILTIADIYDALTAADRPYRKAISCRQAVDVLLTEADRGLLDRDLVLLFRAQVVPALELALARTSLEA